MSIAISPRVERLLNPQQYATLQAAIRASAANASELGQLLKSHTMPEDDAALYAAILTNIIVPHNMRRINAETANILQAGRFVVMTVANGAPMPFAYTIGLAPLVGAEVLCVAALHGQTLGNIVNSAGEFLKDFRSFDALPEGFLKTLDGDPVRLRVDEYPLHVAIAEFCCRVPDHVEVRPEHRVYVIRLPDDEDRLFGEQGYDQENYPQPSFTQ